tara:strand:+ start:378 stop:530 length:153 start_codon:yes stop_codon:yes gene_type:complete
MSKGSGRRNEDNPRVLLNWEIISWPPNYITNRQWRNLSRELTKAVIAAKK